MLKAKKHWLMNPSNQAEYTGYNVIFDREHVKNQLLNVFFSYILGKCAAYRYCYPGEICL